MEANRPINEDTLEWSRADRAGKFGWGRKALGSAAGGQQLGCSLYEIPPGKRLFPLHWHTANEEALYVLAGKGSLRRLHDTLPLRAGDYVAFPVGEQGAHQVINDSDEPLRCLLISTMIEPEIAVQPDSGKYVLFAGSAPGGSTAKRTICTQLPASAKVDYWEGEE